MVKGIGIHSRSIQDLSTHMKSNDSDPLTLMKLLRFGDGHITSEILNYCIIIIENSKNVPEKTNSLAIIGQLVYWADLECLMLINYTELFEDLSQEIKKDRNGRWTIFDGIEGQLVEKNQFLNDFLKYVDLWAAFMPYDNIFDKDNQESSHIALLVNHLKKKKKIGFPHNSLEKSLIR